jgi:hypothetical protein
MYFQYMSVSVGLEEHAAIEAIVACNRLALKLTNLVAQHEHAASVPRPDWTGPHHDTFEGRFAAVQRNLEAGRLWVLGVRQEAEARLAVLQAEAAVPQTGPR